MQDYVSYHSKAGYALLVLSKSVGAKRCVVLRKGDSVQQVLMPAAEFEKSYIRCSHWDPTNKEERLTDPSFVATKMLEADAPFSKEAIDHIERILRMDTRGKSTEQIRAEIVKLSGDLPKGHKLREVPKFSDRGQAIAGYTQMRQTLFNLQGKEKVTMASSTTQASTKPTKASTKAGTSAEAKKPSAATKVDPKAAAKAAKKAAPAPAPEPEVKPNGKSKGSKTAAPAPVPEPTPKGKGKGKPAPEPEVKGGKKAAPAAAAEPKASKTKTATIDPKKVEGKVDLTGPFKLSDEAAKAKTPEELRLHEGSSRFTLMQHIISNSKGKKVSFTVDELKEVCGDQTKQALSGMVRYGFLVATK